MNAIARILLVEDDGIIQRLIATMLEGIGYSVVCAEDGEAGWQVLNGGESYDLVITDNNMPKLSGLDMIRRLRAVPMNLPVILISGEIPRGAKDLDSLLTPGLALEKPFGMAKLLGHVRDCLISVGSSSER
jgi:two-component system response regulator MprA